MKIFFMLLLEKMFKRMELLLPKLEIGHCTIKLQVVVMVLVVDDNGAALPLAPPLQSISMIVDIVQGGDGDGQDKW